VMTQTNPALQAEKPTYSIAAKQRIEKLHYMDGNPVGRGLVGTR